MTLQGAKFTDNEEDKMRKFKGTIGALLAAAILASSFAVPVMAAEELPEQTGEEPVITEPADPAEPGSGDNTGENENTDQTPSDTVVDEDDPAPEDDADNGEGEDLGQGEVQDGNTPDAGNLEIIPNQASENNISSLEVETDIAYPVTGGNIYFIRLLAPLHTVIGM